MKLKADSNLFININGSLIKKDKVQKLSIEKDTKGKKYLDVSTGLISRQIYGKKNIKKFLTENFPVGSMNEVNLISK